MGWPVGLSLVWTDKDANYSWLAFAIVCMGVSSTLILISQRTTTMGRAYAVWTEIRAVGTFLISVMFFAD